MSSRKAGDRRNVSFTEDVDIINRLDDDAKKRGCDRSDIIREAIREKLKIEVD